MRIKTVTPPTTEPLDLVEAKAHLRVEHSMDDALILSLVASARDHAEKHTGRQLVAASFQLGLECFPECITLPTSPGISVDAITYLDTGGTRQTLSTAVYQVDDMGDVWEIEEAWNQYWPAVRDDDNSVRVDFTAGYVIPFTVSGDVLTWTVATPVAGQAVRLSNSGGQLPGGLTTGTTYYVRDVSGKTCKLAATSGGAALTLASAGTGIHFVGEIPPTIKSAMLLMVGHLYENREAVVTGPIATALPLAVESLLNMNKDWRVY